MPCTSLAEPRLLGRREGLVHCLYATCSSGMLGYGIMNRKSVTLRNTRINAGVLDGALCAFAESPWPALSKSLSLSLPPSVSFPPSPPPSLSLSLFPSLPPSLPLSLSLSLSLSLPLPPSLPLPLSLFLLSVNHFMQCKDVCSLTYINIYHFAWCQSYQG